MYNDKLQSVDYMNDFPEPFSTIFTLFFKRLLKQQRLPTVDSIEDLRPRIKLNP